MAIRESAKLQFIIDAKNRAEREFKNVERQIDTTSQSFKRFKMAAGAAAIATAAFAVKIGVDAVQAASEFQKGMANVSTLIDTNKESMEEMSDQVLKMAQETPVAIGDLTTALYNVRSAGIEASAQFDVLENSAQLAVAGLGTTEESVDLITSAINSFNINAKDANQVADTLFKTVRAGKTTVADLAQSFGMVAPIASEVGVTFEELQAATAALTTSGLKTSVAQTQIRAAMASLLKPAKDAQTVFQEIGVSDLPTLIEQSGGLVPALRELREQAELSGIDFSTVMGSVEGLNAALSLTGATSESYENTLASMRGESNALTEAYEKQLQTFDKQWQMLKNNLNVVLIELGNAIMPTLLKVVKSDLIPELQNLSSWFKNNEESVAGLMENIGLLIGDLLQLLKLGKDIANVLVWPIEKFAEGVVNARGRVESARNLGTTASEINRRIETQGGLRSSGSTQALPGGAGQGGNTLNITVNGDVVDKDKFFREAKDFLDRYSILTEVAGQ